jgi:prepilin-type N-terminal cleavage/methylation domain-containing protein
MKINRGFTLIELLVVIAIIGILSSVVIGSLNVARGKAKDVAIKNNLSNMRGQAEIYFDTPGNYGVPFTAGACATTSGTLFADERVANFLTESGNVSSAGSGIGGANCVSVGSPNATSWAVSVPLFTDPNVSWCVDSQGASRQVTPAGGDFGFDGEECKI